MWLFICLIHINYFIILDLLKLYLIILVKYIFWERVNIFLQQDEDKNFFYKDNRYYESLIYLSTFSVVKCFGSVLKVYGILDWIQNFVMHPKIFITNTLFYLYKNWIYINTKNLKSLYFRKFTTKTSFVHNLYSIHLIKEDLKL